MRKPEPVSTDVIVLVLSAFFVCLCLVAFMLSNPLLDYLACQQFAKIHAAYQFHYDFVTGCRALSPDGRWVDAEVFLDSYGLLQIRP